MYTYQARQCYYDFHSAPTRDESSRHPPPRAGPPRGRAPHVAVADPAVARPEAVSYPTLAGLSPWNTTSMVRLFSTQQGNFNSWPPGVLESKPSEIST